MNIHSQQELADFLAAYREDQQSLRTEITNILWHMRGSISREEAWTLSIKERKDIIKLINERIKIVQETKLPLL